MPLALDWLIIYRAGVIGALAFSPDGKTLVTVCGLERKITFWDVATAKEKKTSVEGGTGIIGPLAFSPDGKILAAGNDGMIKLWQGKVGK